MSIGANIKKRRYELKLSQQELADSRQEQFALVHGLVQLDSRTGRDDHEHAAPLSQDFVV